MQLKLRVNNGDAIKGAVVGKGVLGAHIMMVVPAGSNEPKIEARIHAFESSEVSEWRVAELSIGDKIEIELLPGSDADPPTEKRAKFRDADAALLRPCSSTKCAGSSPRLQ